MLLGQFERNLDDKGRLAIPAALRDGLGAGAVLARGFDGCLCIYPAGRWQVLTRAADDLPEVNPEARSLARMVFGSAVPCDLDRQGRVTIPAFLRQHANLRGSAVIVGINSRVEIWSREGWLRENRKIESDGQQEFARALSM
jgi:MraZ protein